MNKSSPAGGKKSGKKSAKHEDKIADESNDELSINHPTSREFMASHLIRSAAAAITSINWPSLRFLKSFAYDSFVKETDDEVHTPLKPLYGNY